MIHKTVSSEYMDAKLERIKLNKYRAKVKIGA